MVYLNNDVLSIINKFLHNVVEIKLCHRKRDNKPFYQINSKLNTYRTKKLNELCRLQRRERFSIMISEKLLTFFFINNIIEFPRCIYSLGSFYQGNCPSIEIIRWNDLLTSNF